MAGLRVRLQFDDQHMVKRKYWLYIDPSQSQTISDVFEDIKKKFMRKCCRLMLKDAELHVNETVAILREEDLLDVEWCAETQEKQANGGAEPSEQQKKKKRKKEFVDNECFDSSVGNVEKSSIRKSEVNYTTKPVACSYQTREELETFQEVPLKKSKKKKNKEKKEIQEYTESVSEADVPQITKKKSRKSKESSEFSLHEESKPVEEPTSSRKKKAEKQIHNVENEDVCNSQTGSVLSQDQSLSEENSKRHRRRRRKKNHATSDSIIEEVNLHSFFENTPEPPKRQHIRFDELDSDTTCAIPQAETTEDVNIAAQQGLSQNFELFDSKSTISADKESSNPLTALLSLRSAVFVRKTAESQVITEKEQPQVTLDEPEQQSGTSSEIEDDISNNQKTTPTVDPTKCPPLKGIPRVGDIIAYKVLEMSENYCPEVSEYRQGKVVDLNSKGDLTIEILGPPVVIKCSGGRFELVPTDEDEEEEFIPEVQSVFIHHVDELIEPRLIYP